MRATLIPINTIQKNPLAEQQGEKLFKIPGWTEFVLDPGMVGRLSLKLVLMISADHVDNSHLGLLPDTNRDQPAGFMLH